MLQPLDARRFRWTPPLPFAVETAGGALLALSWLFLFRSFTDNTFLSPLVRVQTEREHGVVSDGVYGVVRHPMYLGAILMFLGAPLLVGAISALLVGVLLSLLLVARIADEEKLLATELAGYDEYRRKVRYRLLPLVWSIALCGTFILTGATTRAESANGLRAVPGELAGVQK